MNVFDCFQVMLLDMNGTFMFHEDRFGADEDFFATYGTVGGIALTRHEVTQVIRATYESMAADYENPDKHDDFPQVSSVLRLLAPDLSELELGYLDQVFGLHELGNVSKDYAESLQALAKKHRLGLVANIWAKKPLWVSELRRAGVFHLFESIAFSSDYKSVKPSPVLFEMALEPFSVKRSEVVFVGDSLRCDIQGAKNVGLSTVWINQSCQTHPAADFVVSSLLELSEAVACSLR